jgi:hemoglobin-like flavoprotein
MALQVSVLEESFDLVAPRAEEVVERFYERLFTIAPQVQPLFADVDMPHQRQKLLTTLVLLRQSLRDLESVVPTLKALGARHVTYGALPEHYPAVGQALLEAMAEIGGSAWIDDYTRAWTDAYQVVQDTMLSGTTEAAESRALV